MLAPFSVGMGFGAERAAVAGVLDVTAVGALAGAATTLAGGAEALSLSSATTWPSSTISPTLILNATSTPAFGAGISIVALSPSTTNSEVSFATGAPGATSSSNTVTPLAPPKSGTRISVKPFAIKHFLGRNLLARKCMRFKINVTVYSDCHSSLRTQ